MSYNNNEVEITVEYENGETGANAVYQLLADGTILQLYPHKQVEAVETLEELGLDTKKLYIWTEGNWCNTYKVNEKLFLEGYSGREKTKKLYDICRNGYMKCEGAICCF